MKSPPAPDRPPEDGGHSLPPLGDDGLSIPDLPPEATDREICAAIERLKELRMRIAERREELMKKAGNIMLPSVAETSEITMTDQSALEASASAREQFRKEPHTMAASNPLLKDF